MDSDNRGGAREAAAYLIARGRQRAATIAGPQDMCAGIDRLDGYREALRAAGRPFDEELVEVGDFTDASGELAMRRLLARRPDLDAVFAANDLMAAGALHALKASGRRVPGEDMARQMVQLLLARIGGSTARTGLILQAELAVRESG